MDAGAARANTHASTTHAHAHTPARHCDILLFFCVAERICTFEPIRGATAGAHSIAPAEAEPPEPASIPSGGATEPNGERIYYLNRRRYYIKLNLI